MSLIDTARKIKEAFPDSELVIITPDRSEKSKQEIDKFKTAGLTGTWRTMKDKKKHPCETCPGFEHSKIKRTGDRTRFSNVYGCSLNPDEKYHNWILSKDEIYNICPLKETNDRSTEEN
jgi:hypothetical protein